MLVSGRLCLYSVIPKLLLRAVTGSGKVGSREVLGWQTARFFLCSEGRGKTKKEAC